jgi:hypothetical protein
VAACQRRNGHEGEDFIIATAVRDEAAKERFPNRFRAVKPRLRVTPQPNL